MQTPSCAQIRDYLKTLETEFSGYYAGKFDDTKTDVICVYPVQESRYMSIGGEDNTKALHAEYSVLIHGSNNFTTTESKSAALYDEIVHIRNATIGDFTVWFVEPRHAAPIDLQARDDGIYEQVIYFTIHYTVSAAEPEPEPDPEPESEPEPDTPDEQPEIDP